MMTSAEDFLRAFHAEYPAVTARAMAHGRGPDGRSSYEMVRDRVGGRRRVLDLACGDGLLLQLLAEDADRAVSGLDLSAEEVARARRRPGVERADLRVGAAQHLPFPDRHFDGCVSHMALMLMGEIEQVAAELGRVLEVGGTLAVALGAGPGGGEAYEVFLRLLRPVIDAAPNARRIPALGDRRIRTRQGFDAIFREAGFGPAEWETVCVDLTGPPEQVWRTVGGIYDVGPLGAAVTADLRERFAAESAAPALPDGRIPCAMRVHLATARRVA